MAWDLAVGSQSRRSPGHCSKRGTAVRSPAMGYRGAVPPPAPTTSPPRAMREESEMSSRRCAPRVTTLAAFLVAALASPALAAPAVAPPIQLVETVPVETVLGNPALPAAA